MFACVGVHVSHSTCSAANMYLLGIHRKITISAVPVNLFNGLFSCDLHSKRPEGGSVSQPQLPDRRRT